MIHIKKDFKTVPKSLTSKLTNQRRNEIIEQKNYISGDDKYNNRYKTADIKKALLTLYHHKCAFCEQRIERFDIEHFRPKSIYYWLAFSWDNLLLACPTCNGYKKEHFETLATKVQFDIEHLASIHSLSDLYNQLEQNKFVHPELENVNNKIIFKENGTLTSTNERVKYTIETCKLNRDFLTQERREIYADFKVMIFPKILKLKATSNEKLKNEIREEIRPIYKRFFKKEMPFLGFRNYLRKNKFKLA